MKGLELSRKYFEAYGRSMLEEDFSDLLPHCAAGLFGSGSECYGYDDELSQDHDFEPGFCIFLPRGTDERRVFQLERAYAKLPKEFEGYRRSLVSPAGGNRHGVFILEDFFEERIGTEDGYLTLSQWFSLPESALLEAVNGEVFFDNEGTLTEMRRRLAKMPEDIRKKKIAGNLLLMNQSGQYNYPRIMKRNDEGAAQLCVIEFVKAALHTVFLLNRSYIPYYKWTFRALEDLTVLSSLKERLIFLLNTDNTDSSSKTAAMDEVMREISAECLRQGLIIQDGEDLEKLAYQVNDTIRDGEIRNLHILAGV